MKLKINTIIAATVMGLCFGCSAESRIEDKMREETESFNADSKFFITKSELFTFNIGDNLNFLANDTVRDLAIRYADNKGLAGYRRNGANDLVGDEWLSTIREANWLQSSAEMDLAELMKYEAYNVSVLKGGIWALHTICYKEYVNRGYVGPYIKSFLYLYSADGKHVLWHKQVHFEEDILRELLEVTNTIVADASEYSIWG